MIYYIHMYRARQRKYYFLQDSRSSNESRPHLPHKLPVDIVPTSGRRFLASPIVGAGSVAQGGSSYFTDKNYPENFFKSATSIEEMIVRN